VASDSLPIIPIAHQLVAETAFEKELPQALVTWEILDTPVWRWIALTLAALVLMVLTRVLAAGLVRGSDPDERSWRPDLGKSSPPSRLARRCVPISLAIVRAIVRNARHTWMLHYSPSFRELCEGCTQACAQTEGVRYFSVAFNPDGT
jgi:hypothetical protein